MSIMTTEELLNNLDEILQEEDNNIRMYFYTTKKKLFQPVLIEDTFKDIKHSYIESLKKIIGKVENIEEHDLDGNLTTELVYVDSEEKKIEDYINLSSLLANDEHEVLEEKEIPTFYKTVKATVFVINEKIKIIKKFSYPKRLLNKKVINFKKYPLEQVKEDIFSIDNSIDLFEIDGITYILNNYAFECIFSLESEYQTRVNESIELLNNSNLMSGVDEFKSECLKSKTNTKRLLKLLNKNNFEILNERKDTIKTVIENYDLAIELSEEGNIVFSNNCEVGQILNLLGDNYYISTILEEKRLSKANQQL